MKYHENLIKQQRIPINLKEILKSENRGKIAGIAVLSEGFWYDATNTNHTNDPWVIGPFVYPILDVVRLDQAVDYQGQVGVWKCDENIHKQIMKQPSVSKAIEAWKAEYGDKLSNKQFPVYFFMTNNLLQFCFLHDK